MTGVGWLNFFFLGTGGSGMPYFSLLSAALSLYFICSPEEWKTFLNFKMQSRWLGEQYNSLATGWFCIEPNLSFFSFQLFQLCFAHFGSAENLHVFLGKTIEEMITLINSLMVFWLTLSLHRPDNNFCDATLWRSESCWCLTRASLLGNCLLQSKQANFAQSVSFCWPTSPPSGSATPSSGSLSPL